jgi:hypothetical protein
LEHIADRYCPIEDIEIQGTPFASGHFGEICKVKIGQNNDLCMKTLKKLKIELQFEKAAFEDILREAINMFEYNHDNVMSLSFISIDESGFPALIMPYMVNMSLGYGWEVF